MFKTAELHRDALIKLLSIRGDGDILKGLRSITPWSAKAVQWYGHDEQHEASKILTVQVRGHGCYAAHRDAEDSILHISGI